MSLRMTSRRRGCQKLASRTYLRVQERGRRFWFFAKVVFWAVFQLFAPKIHFCPGLPVWYKKLKKIGQCQKSHVEQLRHTLSRHQIITSATIGAVFYQGAFPGIFAPPREIFLTRIEANFSKNFPFLTGFSVSRKKKSLSHTLT